MRTLEGKKIKHGFGTQSKLTKLQGHCEDIARHIVRNFEKIL